MSVCCRRHPDYGGTTSLWRLKWAAIAIFKAQGVCIVYQIVNASTQSENKSRCRHFPQASMTSTICNHHQQSPASTGDKGTYYRLYLRVSQNSNSEKLPDSLSSRNGYSQNCVFSRGHSFEPQVKQRSSSHFTISSRPNISYSHIAYFLGRSVFDFGARVIAFRY